MKTKFGDLLDLIRFPNVFTAFADVLAGYLFAGGLPLDWKHSAPVWVASGCLYCGGMVLNDVCDAKRDAQERPERPIPSGRVTMRMAVFLAMILLAIGSLAAITVSLWIGATIAIAIVLYDAILKRTLLAPWLMGLCRACNLLLGAAAATGEVTSIALPPAIALGAYIASITYFARCEATHTDRRRMLVGLGGACLGLASLLVLLWVAADVHVEFVVVLAATLIGLGRRGWWTIKQGTPQAVQQMVETLVLSIILLDVCVAWSATGVRGGLMVLALLAPAWVFSRSIRVT